ncbi:hypothetical protein [Rodentibacter pneumotropicus]|uniref:Uncharacterized protein n=1 Tax=Rodentibacter pneumotropicus TaxID=758 RepID=A0A4S2Q1X1_9PAST|nr:hypothetical protein [Rodentibacter pneumotropicus]THA10471.1 hypothetical protein D3M78_02930 [Rodentibacter pneumotropicus]
MTTPLTKDDLKVGHVYSAKKPKEYCFPPLLGDRQILWMGLIYDNKEGFVEGLQYDSPSVKNGKHYPKISVTKFLKWAEADVTEIMPKDEWRYAR